jgi:hypothetical protein
MSKIEFTKDELSFMIYLLKKSDFPIKPIMDKLQTALDILQPKVVEEPKVIVEEPKVIVEEKPKVIEDNRQIVKWEDQKKIDIKTLLKVGAIFDYEDRGYYNKKNSPIHYISKITDKTVYYKECRKIRIESKDDSYYGGYDSYKIMIEMNQGAKEHKVLIRKLRPSEFFDSNDKLYDFNYPVPRTDDLGH